MRKDPVIDNTRNEGIEIYDIYILFTITGISILMHNNAIKSSKYADAVKYGLDVNILAL
jgi:hypothetical protein